MFALRSGCLRMVDRNQGLAMRDQERGLSSSGELQRGSNIGRGQVLAADYFIIPDIQHANQDSGGGNVGAAFGHFLPGGFGAVVGNISIHSQEASTMITLVDARTTEQLYIAEGAAKKTDVGFGGGGGFGRLGRLRRRGSRRLHQHRHRQDHHGRLLQGLRRPGSLHAGAAAGRRSRPTRRSPPRP